MKDRIKMIMESQHMTQQMFAIFLDIAPATLSSIFNGRTRPTLNIIEAIKNKLPKVSTDWLMFGTGSMMLNDSTGIQVSNSNSTLSPTPTAAPVVSSSEQLLDFGTHSSAPSYEPEHNNQQKSLVKIVDKSQRKITEIRIFYDDQTWETFVSKK
ncbi:MAG: helix-turn-helix domain-containing protein [Prevotella sp.]|jgi:DNA-binding XRE family transcriptional regulator|nr:helix-turn-helix domain-containing protein [Prevotella sp.]MCI1281123.1 helix-turn-helix domain-containing protein [Prevotella sp.]